MGGHKQNGQSVGLAEEIWAVKRFGEQPGSAGGGNQLAPGGPRFGTSRQSSKDERP